MNATNTANTADGATASTGPAPLVLVVDDEPAFRRAMEVTLAAAGLRVSTAPDGAAAIDSVAAERPALVVLDLGLPVMDGHDVIAAIRGWTKIPILVLSARHDDRDKVRALDAGADDYVTKPFSMDELLARVRAHLRRAAAGTGADEAPEVETADFVVDLARAEVRRREGDAFVAVHLTPTEWRLVEALVRERGRLVSQRDLLRRVWGPEYGTEANYLRVFMGQVRAKLEPSPSTPRYFHTEPGLGYRFEDRGR